MPIKPVFVIMSYEREFYEHNLCFIVPDYVQIMRVTRVDQLRGLHMVGFYIDHRLASNLNAETLNRIKDLVQLQLNRPN